MKDDMDLYQKKFWNKTKKRHHPTHPVIKTLVENRINFIKRYIRLNGNIKILDVGCGNGYYTYHFDRITPYSIGIDYSASMLAINPCKNKNLGDVYKLPFKNDSFDIVFESALLHHLSDVSKVMKEMKRVCKKYVILIEPNRTNPLMFLFASVKKEEKEARKFSLNYMENIVKKVGLKIIITTGIGVILPNKTPIFLLPWLRGIDRKPLHLGVANIIIAKKYG